jgi:hypothetical protein
VRFLAIIYGNRDFWASIPPEEWPGAIAAQDAFNDKHRRSGELVASFGLADETQAKVVRVRAGAPVVTDGPYLETREYIASSWILDVPSLERALEIAADIPFAAKGAVEVWPIAHGDGVDSERPR